MSVFGDLERVARLLVDDPESIGVDEFTTPHGRVFEVRAAEEDLGKLIGRQGRTARSLRGLLAVRGERDGERYELEVVED